MSSTTSAKDQAFWKSLAKNDGAAKQNATQIKAPDATVDSKANGVQENSNYALVPSPRLTETNSNSVASAVANGAQGSAVAVPGGGRMSIGAEQTGKVQIVEKNQ